MHLRYEVQPFSSKVDVNAEQGVEKVKRRYGNNHCDVFECPMNKKLPYTVRFWLVQCRKIVTTRMACIRINQG